MVKKTQSAYSASQRRACEVLRHPRATQRYASVKDDQAVLRKSDQGDRRRACDMGLSANLDQAAPGGLPEKIRVDNGSEFTSKRLDQWAYLNGVRLDFSRPGKPTDNWLIEAFNGRLRAECLNENWFMSLAYAKEKVKAWRMDYNEDRPNSALGNLAPEEFAASSGQASLAG